MKTILFNPFKKYSEKTLLSIGILLTILGSYIAYLFSGRFDGVIDLHFVHEITLWQPLIDNIINIVCLTTLLLLVAKYVNTKSRVIDILSTVIVARIPFYILPFFNINNYILDASEELMSMMTPEKLPDLSLMAIGGILFFGLFSMVFLVWYIILLYNGFKVASNAKSSKSIFLFAVAIIAAEIISKILISNLN